MNVFIKYFLIGWLISEISKLVAFVFPIWCIYELLVTLKYLYNVDDIFNKIYAWLWRKKVDETVIELVLKPLNEPLVELNYSNWQNIATFQRREKFTTRPFHPVITCDQEIVDDPMHPHVSLVYLVEIRSNAPPNSYHRLRALSIWRISTLTGKKKMMATFAISYQMSSYGDMKISAFQSRGAIFVLLQDAFLIDEEALWVFSNFIFVYDTRFNIKTTFEMKTSPANYYKPNRPVAILCLARRSEDGRSIDGWRVRFADIVKNEIDGISKWFVCNVVIDFNMSYSRITHKLVSFEDMRTIHAWILCKVVEMRSSQQLYAFYIEALPWISAEALFAYDARANTFRRYRNQQEFLDADAPLKEYGRRIQWNASNFYCPVLTNRECIVTRIDETDNHAQIFQTNFPAMLTLRMLALRRLIETNPKWKNMSASEFREMTGLDLVVHFE